MNESLINWTNPNKYRKSKEGLVNHKFIIYNNWIQAFWVSPIWSHSHDKMWIKQSLTRKVKDLWFVQQNLLIVPLDKHSPIGPFALILLLQSFISYMNRSHRPFNGHYYDLWPSKKSFNMQKKKLKSYHPLNLWIDLLLIEVLLVNKSTIIEREKLHKINIENRVGNIRF